MGRMVRKQIYIEPRQEEMLKRRARELGVTEAALIRRGIDHAGQAPTLWFLDWDAWEKEKAYIRERMKIVVPQTGRGWTREELYEERLKRLSH